MFNLLKSFKVKLMHYTWDLAIIDYKETDLYERKSLSKYNLIKNPYKTKWFADPFILEITNEHLSVLVEEYDSNIKRGRIAMLKIQKSNWQIVDCQILLDLPTHLSFPVIYRKNDTIYIHPENSASGNSIIYKYDIINEKFKKVNIVAEIPYTDAIIADYWGNNDFYLFATKIPDPNGNNLLIYHSKEFEKGYHFYSELTFKSNIARMAGHIIKTKESLIRPAQDCNGDYGKSVIFQKIDFLNNEFSFTNIGELKPPFLYEGLHTYNTFDDQIAIIDLKRYDYPLIYRSVRGLKKINYYLRQFIFG